MAAFRPASALFEKKPLRPKKLGPPDVYPQEAKQREVSDEGLMRDDANVCVVTECRTS